MYDVDSLHLDSKDGEWVWTHYYNPIYDKDLKIQIEKDYILMQCTGLKDKNGKLIYEGDIVKDDRDTLYVVGFHEHEYTTSFGLKRIENPNYYPHITIYCGLGYKNRNNYEVIGNIYENKELLSA